MAIAEVGKLFDESEKELFTVLKCGYPSDERYNGTKEKLRKIKNNAIRRAIAIMLNDLYDMDTERLSVDIAKVVILDHNEDIRAEPSERIKLLRILWWIVSVYFGGDNELAMRMCREVNRFGPDRRDIGRLL